MKAASKLLGAALLGIWAAAAGGCAGMNGVPEQEPASFVPDACRDDMRKQTEASGCARAMMPLGKSYGEAVMARLDTVLDLNAIPATFGLNLLMPADTRRLGENASAQIGEQCIKAQADFRNRYDAARTGEEQADIAEDALAALSSCFMFANSAAGRIYEDGVPTGKALQTAAERAMYGLGLARGSMEKNMIPPVDLGPQR
jgi:hypothetical protein